MEKNQENVMNLRVFLVLCIIGMEENVEELDMIGVPMEMTLLQVLWNLVQGELRYIKEIRKYISYSNKK